MENNTDLLRVQDAEKSSASGDPLINKLALEMANNKTNAMDTFQKAPDSAFARYGYVTVNGLAHVPEGILNSVKEHAKNPWGTLGTIGMGAGMAVVLKTVLPEGGPAGKIAGAALGAYFTYKAAEPIIDAYKLAGRATTMKDLNVASMQIGNAGGNFVVDSALGAVGYKVGGAMADRVFRMPAMAGFNNAKTNFYNNIGAKLSDSLNISPLKAEPLPGRFHPDGYGVIPPYMLEELAARNPNNGDFLKTRNKTIDIQHPTDQARPRAGQNGNAAREVYDAGGEEVQPGKLVRSEGQKPTGNIDADRVYDYTGDVKDFYLKEYGRNGIDAKGMKYVSTVNYGHNFENAFWDGQQMTYGKPGPNSPFKTFILRDVTGHEITHGITEMEANTQYRGQSGALNESYSDVFGAMVEQYAGKQTADKATWKVGEGIWKENIKGTALRDMLKPGTAYNDPAVGKDPQPAHMKDYVKTWSDNGGVHINSGIPNRAFATFAQSVGGNAWEAPGHIWFEARRAAGANPSFASFAAHTLEAAGKMGKSDLVPKLEAAWKGVGVIPDINAVDILTPGSGAAMSAISGGTSVSYLRSLLNQKAS